MDPFNPQIRAFATTPDGISPRPASQPQQMNVPGMPGGGPPGQPPKPLHNVAPDVKPRLTKEQHDILEAHFQQQHKPSTSTKKGFAESLGVPLDKINNWFQNRRAKVKQDLKKQLNQYNMSMGLYGHNQHGQMPMVNSQFTPSAEQPQPPSQQQSHMGPEYFPSVTGTADISPTCLSVQSAEASSALDLAPQMPLHHPAYDMHALRSIPESGGRGPLPPNIMQSLMAATEGASFMQGHASSLPQQPSAFQYDMAGLAHSYSTDMAFSLPHALPTNPAQDNFSGFPDFAAFECSQYPNMATSSSGDVQNSVGTGSSEPSPFSGNQSTATTQSSVDPNASSVTSITSMFSGWTDEQNTDPKFSAGNDCDDVFDARYDMSQAPTSEHGLFPWDPNGQGQSFPQHDLYQHTNNSAHAILTSPEHSLARKISSGALDFESPPVFGEDMYSRRNSSTSNLANNIEAIHLQHGHTPDAFKQSAPPSSIAARRQKRPTALNSSTLRSASYSGSMPSPGGSTEHTLRRIRSSGIANASGRIQKVSTGSAQRSPMAMTFAEAAASPKFQRAFSASSNTTGGQGGSLAPPTPLTPSERGGYGFWQGNTVVNNHNPMPEHSSPESLSVTWSAEPPSAGIVSSGASPPTTPLDPAQLNHMPPPNDHLYRDTPPQSAPASQQAFSRTTLMQPPQMRSAFHSSTDLTIAQPKPSHYRRPSLPVDGNSHVNESQLQFAVPYGDMSLHGISHNVPFAPPAVMPEFLVHEYNPPLRNGLYRHPSESQTKNYIFANQSPSDFNRP